VRAQGGVKSVLKGMICVGGRSATAHKCGTASERGSAEETNSPEEEENAAKSFLFSWEECIRLVCGCEGGIGFGEAGRNNLILRGD